MNGADFGMEGQDDARMTVFQQMRERERLRREAREAEESVGRSPVLDKMAEHLEAPMSVKDVHGATVCLPAAHPAHHGIVCYAADALVVVWDWMGDTRKLLPGHARPVEAMGFTAGGGLLASTDGMDLVLWEAAAGWGMRARASKVLQREGGRRVMSLVCAGTESKPMVVTAEGVADVTATRGPSKGAVLRVWDASSEGLVLCGQFVFDHEAVPPSGGLIHLCMGGMGTVLAATRGALWCFQIEAGVPQEGAMLPGEGDAGRLEPLRGMGAEGGGRGGMRVSAKWVTDCARGGGRRAGRGRGGAEEEEEGEDVLVGCCYGAGGVFALSSRGILYEAEELRGGIVRVEEVDDGGGAHTCITAHPGDPAGRVMFGTMRGVVSVRRRGKSSGVLAVSSRIALASDLHRGCGPRAGQRGRGWGPEGVAEPGGGGSRPERTEGFSIEARCAPVACLCATGEVVVAVTPDNAIRVLDAGGGGARCMAQGAAHFGPGGVISCAVTRGGWPAEEGAKPIFVTAGAGDETVFVWSLGRGPRARATLFKGYDVGSMLSDALSYHRLIPTSSFVSNDVIARGERGGGGGGGFGHSKQQQQCLGGSCVALRPDRSLSAVGTAYGCVFTIKLSSGYEPSKPVPAVPSGAGGVSGVAFSPGGGRYLAVRSFGGWVGVLDTAAGLGRLCTLQDGGASETGGAWPAHAHEVMTVGGSLLAKAPAATAREGGQFHVVTRTGLRVIGIYKVDPVRATSTLVHSIQMECCPCAIILHPSGHFLAAFFPQGGGEVVHLHSARTRGSFPEAMASNGAVKAASYDPSGVLLVTCSDHVGSPPGGSVLRLWCAESGLKLGELVHGVPKVLCLDWLPMASGIVLGCASGVVVTVGLKDGVRSRSRAVSCGREQNGGGVEEYWLDRPINFELTATRRQHASDAARSQAAKQLQARIRLAIDPIGPCVHLARRLMPYVLRNALRRQLGERLEREAAAVLLQASVRRGAVQSRLAEWLSASLTLQASVRRMLGGRKAEETVYLPERMAAEEMIKRGDPGGRGLWLGAGVTVLSSLPRCLVKGGMWEDVGKVMTLVFVSRMVRYMGVRAALSTVERAMGEMAGWAKAGARGRRRMEGWELARVSAAVETLRPISDLLREGGSRIQSSCWRFPAPTMDGCWSKGWSGEAGWALDLEAPPPEGGLLAIADGMSLRDPEMRSLCEEARGCGRAAAEASRELRRSGPPPHGYAVRPRGGDAGDRGRAWICERLGGAAGAHIWARCSAKGVIPSAGGVRYATMRGVFDALSDPCTEGGGLGQHAVAALCAVGAVPVPALAWGLVKELRGAADYGVLAHGVALEAEKGLRIGVGGESDGGWGGGGGGWRSGVGGGGVGEGWREEQMGVACEGGGMGEEWGGGRQEAVACCVEAGGRWSWHDYLRVAVSERLGDADGWGEARRRVVGWVRGMMGEGGGEGVERVSVVRMEEGAGGEGGGYEAMVCIAVGRGCGGGAAARRAGDHVLNRWEKDGRGFAALSVVSCERSSPSLFLSMLPLPHKGRGGEDGAERRAWLDETGGGLGGIFRSHTRQTLLADCPGASPQDVEREVEARAAAYAREVFESSRRCSTAAKVSAPGGWILVQVEGEEAERKVRVERGAYLAGQLAREIARQLDKGKGEEKGQGQGGREGGGGGPVLCTVSSGGGQVEFTFSSRSKFRVRACHQLSQLLGLQTDNRDDSGGRREEGGGWTPSTPIEGVGWGVTGKGWMCLSVEAGLSSAWVGECLRREVLRQTSLPSGCVRACPGAEGGNGRVVLECRAVGGASLKTVWNAVESLVEGRRDAEESGGGVVVWGGALGACVDMRVYVSPCPPPPLAGRRLGGAMGGCRMLLKGVERAEYSGERNVCDSVVMPAASSYISQPTCALAWMDISAPSASASCTAAELNEGDALSRAARTCTVPWVGAGMGRGAPLSLSLGNHLQEGQEGEEVVSLERSGAFRRTAQWAELKLAAPAAFAAYEGAGGGGKRGGYPTSFLGYSFSDAEAVNHAKRLKAVLMKRRTPGDSDPVGDALRRDLGLTCSLVLTQRKLQGKDDEEWPHGDEAVANLSGAHLGGTGEGSSAAGCGVRLSLGGFAYAAYTGVVNAVGPYLPTAPQRQPLDWHLVLREGQWRECEIFDEMSAEADDGERGRVVAHVLDWVQEGKGGIVALHGSQFAGKTSIASRVAIRASMMSRGSGNGANPVVALCFAGGMVASEAVDYLRREISLLWRGGVSLIHRPSPAIRQGSDILPEGDAMTSACDELVKTLISACKDGVSVLAVLDGATPDTCEFVSSAWARARSEIRNSGWYRQLKLSGGDRPLIDSREERILADARAALEHASGALAAAREQLKQLVVGASSLDDWEASAPERARIEAEVARLAEEEDEANRSLQDAARDAAGGGISGGKAAGGGGRNQCPWVGLVYTKTPPSGKGAPKKPAAGKEEKGGEQEKVVNIPLLAGKDVEAVFGHWADNAGLMQPPPEGAISIMVSKKDAGVPLYSVMAARELAVSPGGWAGVESINGTVEGLWAGGGGKKAAPKKGKKKKKGGKAKQDVEERDVCGRERLERDYGAPAVSWALAELLGAGGRGVAVDELVSRVVIAAQIERATPTRVAPRIGGGWGIVAPPASAEDRDGGGFEPPETLPGRAYVGGVLCDILGYDAEDGGFRIVPAEGRGGAGGDWAKGGWVRGGAGVELRAEEMGGKEIEALSRSVRGMCDELSLMGMLRGGVGGVGGEGGDFVALSHPDVIVG